MVEQTLGSGGMTMLYYTGSESTQTYRGPSGAIYRFGTQRPLGYVDNRDVDHLLTLQVDNQPVFTDTAPQAAASAPVDDEDDQHYVGVAVADPPKRGKRGTRH